MTSRVEGIGDTEDDAAGGGGGDPDAEGDRRDPVDVDPDQLRRGPVEHRGTDRATERGAIENEEEHG